jgi:hypothetical protein
VPRFCMLRGMAAGCARAATRLFPLFRRVVFALAM